MISLNVTLQMLVNCSHCVQPSDNILLCSSTGMSVPVDLYNHMSLSAASVFHILSLFSFLFFKLFYLPQLLFQSVRLSPTLPLTLICLSLGLFTGETFKPHLVRIALQSNSIKLCSFLSSVSMAILQSGPATSHESLIISNISYNNDDNGARENARPVMMMMVVMAMMVILTALC